MATLATVSVKLIGDISDFESKMDKAESKMGKISGSLAKAGGIITGAVTLPIVGAGVKALGMASDMSEAQNKVEVVFGDMSGSIEDFASTASESLGLSQTEALEAAGTYGNLFTAMEIGPDLAADMSTGLVTLASDLASFNNIDPSVALEKLRSGLTGETEPLKTLGVNLNQAMLEAKAMEMGLVTMTEAGMEKATEANFKLTQATDEYQKALDKYGPLADETTKAQIKLWKAQEKYDKTMEGSAEPLTAAQKAQAAYALIMEQTTNAQGDFARTSDGLANSQRIVSAQFKDIVTTMGQELLPIGLQVVTFVKDLLSSFMNLSPEMRRTIVIVLGIVAAIGPLLLIISTLIGAFTTILPVIAAVGGVISGPLLLAIGAIIAIAVLLYKAWTNNWGGIQEKTQAVIDFIRKTVSVFLDKLKAFWEEHGEKIMFIANALWSFIQNIVATVSKIIQDIIGGALKFIQNLWDKYGGLIMGIVSRTWETIKATIDSVLKIIGHIIDAVVSAINGDWESFGKNLRLAWDEAWTAIKRILQTAWLNIKDVVKRLVKDVVEFFTKTDWVAVGKSIVEGIANGLKNFIGIVIDAAKALAKAAWAAITGFFDSHSASKLFMKAGRWNVEGLAIGMSDHGPVIKAAEGLAQSAWTAMSPITGQMGGNTHTETNYNVTGTFKAEPEQSLTERLRLLQMLKA